MTFLDLFSQINEEIECCLLKGSESLAQSFCGGKDLDLLVSRSNQHKIQKTLIRHGFRQVDSAWHKFQHATEHYIWYDHKTTEFHHLHIHYQIILGNLLNTEYQLPYVFDWIKLSDLHEKFPIKVLPKELELAFELLRALVETNNTPFQALKNQIACWHHGHEYATSARFKFNEKFDFLELNLCEHRFNDFLDQYFKFAKSEVLELRKIYKAGKLTPKAIWKLSASLKPRIRDFCRYQRSDAKTIIKLRKTEARKDVAYRSLRSGGILVSIIGADGAGKSTMCEEIKNWLTWGRLTTRVVYLGEPKGLRVIYPLLALNKIFNSLNFSSASKYCIGYIELIKARKRKKNVLKAIQLRNKGFLVISDRYPLQEFRNTISKMDACKLPVENPLYPKVISIFDSIPPHPDAILFLTANKKTLEKRRVEEITKNQTKKEKITQKNADVSGVAKNLEVKPVDTTKNWKYVWQEVRHIIWGQL